MNDLRKGLKLPVVALPGVGHMPVAGEHENEKEAARVFYVAATRTTLRLVMGVRRVRQRRRIGAQAPDYLDVAFPTEL